MAPAKYPDSNACTFNYIFYGQSGCPYDLESAVLNISAGAWRKLAPLKHFNAAMMIAIGLAVCLYGLKFIQYIVSVLIFALFGMSAFIFMIFIVFRQQVTGQKLFLSILISIVIGCEAAYLLRKKVQDNALGVIASWCLISLGFVVLPLVMPAQQKYNDVKLAIYVALGLIGYYMARNRADSISVYMTSFAGAYCFVRGISLYLGGFIDEINWTIDPETTDYLKQTA